MISFCMIPIFSIPNESPRSPRPTNIVSDCANILSILDTAVPVSILGMTEAAWGKTFLAQTIKDKIRLIGKRCRTEFTSAISFSSIRNLKNSFPLMPIATWLPSLPPERERNVTVFWWTPSTTASISPSPKYTISFKLTSSKKRLCGNMAFTPSFAWSEIENREPLSNSIPFVSVKWSRGFVFPMSSRIWDSG